MAVALALGGTASAHNKTKAAAGSADPNGVLNVGDNLGGPTGVEFDPVGANSYTSWRYDRAIYGSLLIRQPDGTYKPGLATAWNIVDPQTVDLTLRQGVTFQDGTPFNAEAVQFDLQRVIAAAPKSYSFSVESKNLQDVQILDTYKVRLKLNAPVAGWLFSGGRPFFGSPETLMPSPAAIKQQGGLAAHPVGAGPFSFVSYTRAESLELKKNDSYYDAKNVKLAGVKFTNVVPGAAQVLALRSGDVDIENLSDSQLSQLTGSGNLTVSAKVTGGQHWSIYMCKSTAPFNDVRVRQALSYAIDRNTINTVLFQGKDYASTGILPKGNPWYVPSLDGYYKYNPSKAKKLLAEAGASNLTISVMYGTTTVPGADLGQMIKSQLAKVGITMNLVPIQNSVQQFFAFNPTPANAVLTPGNDIGMVDLSPGGIGNACQYNDPALNDLLAKIKAATPQSKEQLDLIAQYQKYILDKALITWVVRDAEVFAWNPSRVGGVKLILGNWPGPREIQYESLFVKKG